MRNDHGAGHFKYRLMILLLSLVSFTVMAGESLAATTCSTCHGMPPLDSVTGVRTPSTGAIKGSHQAHVSPSAVPSDCIVCHSAAAGYGMNHSATSGNVIGLSASINGGTYSKGTFFNQTSVPVMGNCSNVTCHANVYGAGGGTSPFWGSTGNGCSTCHTVAIDSTGPATGSHAIHNVTDCTLCHAAGTTASTTPGSGHLDGTITVTNGYPVTAKHAAGTYTGTCSTASCHANVYGTGSVATPEWGSTGNGCSACHTVAIGTNGPATGSHAKHGVVGVACTTCHAAGTTATTAPSKANGHIDGNVDIFYFSYPVDVEKHAAGSNYGTCSTAYCHSNGKGTFVSPTWGGASTGCTFCHPNLSAGHSTHIGSLLSEITFYAYTSNKSTGADNKFGCANCHPTSVGNHMNSTVDVDLTANVAGGSLKAKNGAWTWSASQCNNVYCHSNGYTAGSAFSETPVWGGSFAGDRCAACHGNSPNSGGKTGSAAHSAHVVGIHYEDIFNGVSRKLPQGGSASVNAAHGRNSRSTTINCNICHAATVSTFANDSNPACSGCHNGTTAPLKNPGSLIGNKANHVNGKVDISFIDSKIATKAQLANSAFAGYTAANAGGWARNSNGMSFKTYTSSYDVSKSTLFAAASWSQASGCANVACHNGKVVKWTDAVDCTSCHTRLK